MNVSIEVSGGSELLLEVSPVPNADVNMSDYAVVLQGTTAWMRVADITATTPTELSFSAYGLRDTTLFASGEGLSTNVSVLSV